MSTRTETPEKTERRAERKGKQKNKKCRKPPAEKAIRTQEKIDLLLTIIDKELAKPEEEADFALVQTCMRQLEALSGERRTVNEEALSAGLRKIYEKVGKTPENLPEISSNEHKNAASARRKIMGKLLKITAVAAAVLLTAFSSVTVIARVDGYDNSMEWIDYHWSEILKLAPGTHDIGGVTVTIGEKSKRYSSVEEWIQETNLDILYPGVLPEGVKVDHIIQTFYNENDFDIDFVFKPSSIRFGISNYDISLYQEVGGYEIIEIENRRFEIIPTPDKGYQATCASNGFVYILYADTHENLVTIIQNMKGIQK